MATSFAVVPRAPSQALHTARREAQQAEETARALRSQAQAAQRSAERKGYFELDAQPPMMTPYTPSEEIAKI